MIRYFPETDTLAIELRPWPEASDSDQAKGGEDAGEDLVIHCARWRPVAVGNRARLRASRAHRGGSRANQEALAHARLIERGTASLDARFRRA